MHQLKDIVRVDEKNQDPTILSIRNPFEIKGHIYEYIKSKRMEKDILC